MRYTYQYTYINMHIPITYNIVQNIRIIQSVERMKFWFLISIKKI